MDSILQKLLFGFVTLIVGVMLVGVVADNVGTVNSLSSKTDSFTIVRDPGLNDINTTYLYTVSAPPTGWKLDYSDCAISNFVYKNQSGATQTVNTAYTIVSTTAGTFTLKNVTTLTDATSNATTATYNYCGDTYLPQSWQRNIISLIAGFFALALLIVAVAIFYGIAKDTGIIQ